MRTTSTSQEDRSSQKENTVGDIFKNSYLFQTQQAEILGLDFKILALFLFLICLGYKIKHKNVFSLRSLDLQILTPKKETCPVFFFFPPFSFLFFLRVKELCTESDISGQTRALSTCVLVKWLYSGQQSFNICLKFLISTIFQFMGK